MLDRLRKLWIERPAVVAAAVIAPIAFVVTLLFLFLVVGGGESAQPEQEAAVLEAQPAQQGQQEEPAHQASVVVSGVATDDPSQQEQSEQDASQGSDSQQQTESPTAEEDGTQAGQGEKPEPGQQAGSEVEDEVSQPHSPQVISGMSVVPLSAVLKDELDEQALKHGTDGSEGGILPIDNGVVVSSLPEHRTKWELIIPSAGLKSAVVRVGRTPRGAMGSPDNPYVIGWLESSAAPGESGNTLLAGHRDFEDISGNIGTGVCWELVNTEPGDQMIVRDNERDIYYVYAVTEAVTLDPRNRESARYLWDTDEPVITLITCTGSFNADTNRYSHRFVVVGELAAVASPDA